MPVRPEKTSQYQWPHSSAEQNFRSFTLMTRLSVILPFYNAANSLQQALDSIRKQSFTDFECLMVNNNSCDNSTDIAKNMAETDSRFRLLHENRQGVSYASVHGSSRANGTYIARMDADDIAFPERFQLQLDYLEMHPQVAALGGLVHFGGHHKKAAGLHRYVNWNNSLITAKDIRLRRFIESPVINPTAMWRRDVEKKAGGYRHGNFPEDYELWLRWIDQGYHIEKVPETILQWNDPPQRLTRTDDRYSSDAFYEVKTRYLTNELQRINPHHPNVYVWGASRLMRRRAEKLLQHGIKIKAWVDISEKRHLETSLIHYSHLPAPDNAFVLVYVPQHNIRQEISTYLKSRGFTEGKNYLLVG
ncbi:MAG TPA: glycosyltransferase family 2 protein [Bacteroidales bacterium]|nr:glycosyltransferase family 2 protein [Bacteroidales bacterium]